MEQMFICRDHPRSCKPAPPSVVTFSGGREAWILWVVGNTRGRSESQTCNMHPSFTLILLRQTGGPSVHHQHKVTIPAPTCCNSAACSLFSLTRRALPRVCEPPCSPLNRRACTTNEVKFERTRSSVLFFNSY